MGGPPLGKAAAGVFPVRGLFPVQAAGYTHAPAIKIKRNPGYEVDTP
jgi:hypothetical protein